MKKARDKRKAKGKSAASEAVELTDEQVSGAAGGGDSSTYTGGTVSVLINQTSPSGRGTGTPDVIVSAGPGAGPHVKG